MLKHLQRAPSRRSKQRLGSGQDEKDAAFTPSSSPSSPKTRVMSATVKTLPATPDPTLPNSTDSSSPPPPPSKGSLDTSLQKRQFVTYSRTKIRPSTSSGTNDISSTVDVQRTEASASEIWRTPEDADGAYVRRTYAHFDAKGVKGDGLLQGKEWTREKGPRPVWESEEGRRQRRVSMPPPRSQPYLMKVSSEEVEASDQAPLPVPSKKAPNAISESESTSHLHTSPLLITPEEDGDQNSALRVGMSNVHLSSSSLESNSDESLGSPHQHLTIDAEDERLNAERAELVKKTDRYGFFPQTDDQLKATGTARLRFAVLPMQQLRHIPRRRLNPLHNSRSGGHHHFRHHGVLQSPKPGSDCRGDEDAGANDAEARVDALQKVLQLRSNGEAKLQKREALRAGKWTRMLDIGRASDGRPLFMINAKSSRTRKLKERTYKGVPDRWRSAVWWALLCTRPDVRNASEHEESYKKAQLSPSPHDVQIDLDVPRTISGHILFHTRYGEGQRALFHVLHAFSLLCTQCGYCQGMGPIVATLLVYLPPERAYAVMVELHRAEVFGMHSTFSAGFPGLIENFYAQSKLIKMLFPEVATALESHGIVTSAYATKWYITLYTNVVPFSTQLRLWDAFFLQGKDVLVVVATAILWSLRIDLCQGDFETCMGLLGSEFIPVDDDAFLQWIYSIMQRDDVRRCLSSARCEWKTMIDQGKELPIL